MTKADALPYRPCVGVMLINAHKRAFVGHRSKGPEQVDLEHAWQMPQGGLDEGEDPYEAALRELYEETNIRSVERIAESRDWLTYDLPPELMGKAWKGKYRGQAQKWYLLRFTGEEREIDVLRPAGGAHKPEFDSWRWEEPTRLPALIVPFKRGVYDALLAEFLPVLERL